MRILYIAILLAVMTAAVHSFLALQQPGLSPDAYLRLRSVESVRSTGLPLVKDPLSLTGKRLLISPLYDYLIAAMPLSPVMALKIVPALLLGLVVLLVFVLTTWLASEKAAFFAALSAAMMPALAGFVNTGSAATLALVLALLSIMAIVKFSAVWLAVLVVVLSFSHPSVVLVLFGLAFYRLLLAMTGSRADKGLSDTLIFSVLFVSWSLVIRFRDVFLLLGTGVFYMNIPTTLQHVLYGNVNVMGMVLLVGIVPALAASHLIYFVLLKEHAGRDRKSTRLNSSHDV
jgi:hypothetical protein